MQRDIRLTWFYNYPPETIWNFLSKPELLRLWTKVNDFRPETGFEFFQQEKPNPSKGWDGMMYHKVLEVIPFKKLSYTFQGGPEKCSISLDTVVTWTLIPKNGGTELQLEHTGFEGAKNYFTSYILELGWKNNVAKKFKKALAMA